MESPLRYFSSLMDPRAERTREHDPEDILFIASPKRFRKVEM
jgi:hypothetical protein